MRRSRPLAFGMRTYPLPGTDAAWLHWDQLEGGRIYLMTRTFMRAVEHPSANGSYKTVGQFEAAARAFITAAGEAS